MSLSSTLRRAVNIHHHSAPRRSTDIQGAKTSVQATKASVENLNLLQAGRGELALALGDSVADA